MPLLLVLASSATFGQTSAAGLVSISPDKGPRITFDEFISNDHSWQQSKKNLIGEEFRSFVEQLNGKRHKYQNEVDFLRFVYYKVHQRYLDHYQTPVTIKALFEDQIYDCLTGTALYAMIFDQLGVNYQITETAYHIYMTVNTEQGKILIESTNPLNGFITDIQLIAQLINRYAQDWKSGNSLQSGHYQFNRSIQNVIGLKQLAGLYYYNIALQSYNQQDLPSAILQLERGLDRYPSSRLEEVMAIMLKTLSAESNIDQKFKNHYLNKYAHLLQLWSLASKEP